MDICLTPKQKLFIDAKADEVLFGGAAGGGKAAASFTTRFYTPSATARPNSLSCAAPTPIWSARSSAPRWKSSRPRFFATAIQSTGARL